MMKKSRTQLYYFHLESNQICVDDVQISIFLHSLHEYSN